MKQRLNGDEGEAITRWRRFLRWRPGQRKAAKRRAWRRLRREGRREARDGEPMTDRLTEIVREAYLLGAHGDCHFVMAAATRDALVGVAAPPRGDDVWLVPQDVWARLTAIPVVLDNATGPGVWRLVNRAGDEIERGAIDVEVPHARKEG